MAKVTLVILSIIFIASCSTTAKTPLFSYYKEYTSAVSAENLNREGRNFLSLKLVSDDDLDNDEAREQLLFNGIIASVESHYERQNDKKGCLTVNGFNEINERVILNLEYESAKPRWLISGIHIVFNENEPVETATCPDDVF